MPSGYDSLAPVVARAEAALAAYPEPLVPCHNDLLAANFLDDGQDVRIIDYEYSGLDEAERFVDLLQLVCGAGAVALLLRQLDVGVRQVVVQPSLVDLLALRLDLHCTSIIRT